MKYVVVPSGWSVRGPRGWVRARVAQRRDEWAEWAEWSEDVNHVRELRVGAVVREHVHV